MVDSYYLELFLRLFAICLVITGIHGYLGIHVLSRQVIFVDLAMAQIAALGATYAFLLGFDPKLHPEDALPSYLFALGFTLLGAAIFAVTRGRQERVPQEAIIGIVYASTSALVILMLAKSPHAGEHIQHMLVGNILLVGWPTIAETAAIYAVIGLFHWLFRRRFLEVTLDPGGAERAGRRIRLWDFLFYMTFGVVITRSVAIAGVLLVFSFLVVPAAIGVLFADRIGARIAISWAMGTLVSVLGIAVSFSADLPAGPAVVTSFAVVLVGAGLVRFVQKADSPYRAVASVVATAALLTVGLYGTTLLRKEPEIHEHRSEFSRLVDALGSDDEGEQVDALHHVAERADPHFLPHVLRLLEKSPSGRVREHVARLLPAFRDPSVIPVLVRVAAREREPFLRIELARAVLLSGSADGIPILVEILEGEEAALPRTAAFDVLARLTGETFGYDPDATPAENAAALDRWRAYWRDRGANLRWREQRQRFE